MFRQSLSTFSSVWGTTTSPGVDVGLLFFSLIFSLSHVCLKCSKKFFFVVRLSRFAFDSNYVSTYKVDISAIIFSFRVLILFESFFFKSIWSSHQVIKSRGQLFSQLCHFLSCLAISIVKAVIISCFDSCALAQCVHMLFWNNKK